MRKICRPSVYWRLQRKFCPPRSVVCIGREGGRLKEEIVGWCDRVFQPPGREEPFNSVYCWITLKEGIFSGGMVRMNHLGYRAEDFVMAVFGIGLYEQG